MRRHALGMLLFLLLAGGCAGVGEVKEVWPTSRPAVRLRVAAVPSGRPYLRQWLALYQARHPEAVLEIVPAGPKQTQEMLAQGKVALAVLDREMEARYRGILTATWVISVPLAVVVHPDNPLRDLSSAAAVEAFSGRVGDWGLLGGEACPLQVHLLPDSWGVVQAFARQALAGRSLAPQARVHASPALLRQALAQDPGGIGLLPIGETTGEVVSLRIDGRLPSEEGYPWRMPLYLLWGAEVPQEA
ncbi:MAG: substrate-binding domain-containing protein, partial [Chloroflexia bacterium]